jgi:hypothetical protein
MEEEIIELRWHCGECSTRNIKGRYKKCPSCGSPREKGEMDFDGLDDASAPAVTDEDLLDLANAGEDWFCTHCGSGSCGDSDVCSGCGAPRYGKSEEKLDLTPDRPKRKVSTPEIVAPGAAAVGAAMYQNKTVDDVDWPPKSRVASLVAGFSGLTMFLLFGGILSGVVVLAGGIWWATQTHEVVGVVSGHSWKQTAIREHWTDVIARKWQHNTFQRAEVKPINGVGAQAGLELVPLSCRDEHHHYEEYQCGVNHHSRDIYRTEKEKYSCTKKERYKCGTKRGRCTTKKNGFASCEKVPKYCTRNVQDTCTRNKKVFDHTENWTTPKMCDRSVKKPKCKYKTQEWKVVQTEHATGSNVDTRWPEVQPGPLDRVRRKGTYDVTIDYTDWGKHYSHTVEPETEVDFKHWEPGLEVTLVINNLGGVRDVRKGKPSLSRVES